ncbi:hypothetical protein VTN00DRAFT_1048 [Thermoascus crustaceus]|uniref:uncharacterized protein n=1 Tax=Thermoascus crustaceus TaxID=5088 RepID=UPI00374351AA
MLQLQIEMGPGRHSAGWRAGRWFLGTPGGRLPRRLSASGRKRRRHSPPPLSIFHGLLQASTATFVFLAPTVYKSSSILSLRLLSQHQTHCDRTSSQFPV